MILTILVFLFGCVCFGIGACFGWFLRSQDILRSAGRPKPGMPEGWVETPTGYMTPDGPIQVDDVWRFPRGPIKGRPPHLMSTQRPNAAPPITTIEPREERQQQNPIVFRDKDNIPYPTRKAWGDLPYDELEPMFLDQFLLRYFPELMPPMIPRNDGAMLWWRPEDSITFNTREPWASFIEACPWAKDMPLLFEQLTGYKLNEMQLNNAIAEYVRRLQKAQKTEAKA